MLGEDFSFPTCAVGFPRFEGPDGSGSRRAGEAVPALQLCLGGMDASTADGGLWWAKLRFGEKISAGQCSELGSLCLQVFSWADSRGAVSCCWVLPTEGDSGVEIQRTGQLVRRIRWPSSLPGIGAGAGTLQQPPGLTPWDEPPQGMWCEAPALFSFSSCLLPSPFAGVKRLFPLLRA